MAVAVSLVLEGKLKEILAEEKQKGEFLFTVFESPEMLEKLLVKGGEEKPRKVFVSIKEVEPYLKLKEKFLPSEFVLYVFGKPPISEPYLSLLRKTLLIEFISSPAEVKNFLREEKLKWFIGIVEDEYSDIKLIKKTFSSPKVKELFEVEPGLSPYSDFSFHEEDFIPIGGEPGSNFYRLKEPEEVIKEIEALMPSGIILDLSWRRDEEEKRIAKELLKEVNVEKFMKEWEKGDIEKGIFKVSGLKFLKLVEEKLKRGDTFPPIFVLTLYTADRTFITRILEELRSKCNVYAATRKNWDWLASYDGAEYIALDFLRHTINYYRGLRKAFPPFKCFLTEKAEEAEYILLPIGKEEREMEKIISQVYVEKFGSLKEAADALGVSEQTIKNRLKIKKRG